MKSYLQSTGHCAEFSALRHVVWSGIVLALCCSYAVSQSPPEKKAEEVKPAAVSPPDQGKADESDNPVTKTKRQPEVKSSGTTRKGAQRKLGGNRESKPGEGLPAVTPRNISTRKGKGADFEMDPQAKWACEQQTVTLEPVWRDGDSLTFNFLIRNEGTANLRIQAKGG